MALPFLTHMREKRPAVPVPSAGPQQEMEKLRILVVGDAQVPITLLRQMGWEQRHTIDVTQAGPAARGLAGRTRYDLIMLDLPVTGLDGLELCRWLRVDGVTSPLLMLSANGTPADRVDGFNAGADDYLVEPIAAEELRARLIALLRRRNGAAPFGRPPQRQAGQAEQT